MKTKFQWLLVWFFVWFAPFLTVSARAHELQVEPVVATIRPQSTFLTVEFSGNGEDIVQAADVTDSERSVSSMSQSVWPRLEAYMNEKFVLRQGGQTLTGKIVRLDYERPDTLDYQTSKFSLIMRYERPAELADKPFEITNSLFDYLPNAQTILSLRGLQKQIGPGQTVNYDPTQVAANLWANIRDFAVLGAEHIFLGPDHLLFILALLLTSNSFWTLVKTLTGFTVAHSITLVLSALDVITIPTLATEILIAVSIIWVGVENIFFPKLEKHRFFLAGAFGLVHGFGFSYILREIGLPEEGLAWTLLSFNIGVEIAQVMVCALVWPILIALKKKFDREAQYGGMGWPKAVKIGSWAVIAMGGFWLIERVAGAFTSA